MASYKLIVLSDGVDGRDAEYNDWYTNQHLADVVAVPGFVSAQRFKMRELTMGEFKNKYLAIYNIETDDPDKVMAEMMSRRGTEAMYITDAFDMDNVNVALFEVISEEVFAPGAEPTPA
jgi:hypothetical protein